MLERGGDCDTVGCASVEMVRVGMERVGEGEGEGEGEWEGVWVGHPGGR